MTIYIDAIFVENLIMNLAIIFVEAIVLNLTGKKFRKIVAGILGSIFYILSLIFPVISLIQIVFTIILVKIAFNPYSLKLLIKETILFYGINFVFGGVSFAIVNLVNNGKINILNGILLGKFSIYGILLSAIIGSIIVIFLLKKNKKNILRKAIISLKGIEKEIKVLFDTGNFLKEPYTDKPVIIVEKNILKGLVSGKVIDNFNDILKRKSCFTYWNVYCSI